MAQWAMIFGGMGRDRDEDSRGGVIGGLYDIVAPIAAMLIQMAVSRSRYRADATGAKICAGRLLANALVKLEDVN
jgi:heat shock protein HtpX